MINNNIFKSAHWFLADQLFRIILVDLGLVFSII